MASFEMDDRPGKMGNNSTKSPHFYHPKNEAKHIEATFLQESWQNIDNNESIVHFDRHDVFRTKTLQIQAPEQPLSSRFFVAGDVNLPVMHFHFRSSKMNHISSVRLVTLFFVSTFITYDIQANDFRLFTNELSNDHRLCVIADDVNGFDIFFLSFLGFLTLS